MQASDSEAGALVIVFCDRDMLDCTWIWDKIANRPDYFEQHYTWAVVYTNDFDGRIWADKYGISETPGIWLQADSTLISPVSPAAWEAIFQPTASAPEPPAKNGNTEDLVDPLRSSGQKLSSSQQQETLENPAGILPDFNSVIEVSEVMETAPGFYRVNTHRIEATGFTIQVANFGTYAELLYYTERIAGILNVDVITEMVHEEGSIRYKVLLGMYPTREEAMAKRHKLNEMGIEGFIRKIN